MLERLGVVMEPAPEDAREAWGVLNPACARGRVGALYLFPRLVAEGNFSRIGRARVLHRGDRPVGVERLGIALEPAEAWERNAVTGGGIEDPRITFVERLDRYVMTYSAYGPLGPRIGVAVSHDLETWTRLGPVSFAYEPGLATDLNLYSNKDAVLFPEPVAAPNGRPSWALLHRPTWDLSWLVAGEGAPLPAGVADGRPGIWVSFAPADGHVGALTRLAQHRVVALPEHPWEALKIGAGPPPLRTDEGWLVLHHGVSADRVYSAGSLLLDLADVTRVVARSRAPLLAPETREERVGIVGDVVFPTAIDGEDVYYGMADARIGVARLTRRRRARVRRGTQGS